MKYFRSKQTTNGILQFTKLLGRNTTECLITRVSGSFGNMVRNATHINEAEMTENSPKKYPNKTALQRARKLVITRTLFPSVGETEVFV